MKQASLNPILLIHEESVPSRDLFSILSSRYPSAIGPSLTDETYLDLNELKQYAVVAMMASDIFPKIRQDFIKNVATYVEEGGILLAMPFLAWSVKNKDNPGLDHLLPVKCTGFFENETAHLVIGKQARYWSIRGEEVKYIDLRVSGEFLKAKDGSKEYVRDTTHRSTVLAIWKKKKGLVIYVNLTHHSCNHGAIPVWTNRKIQSLVLLFLDRTLLARQLKKEQKLDNKNSERPAVHLGTHVDLASLYSYLHPASHSFTRHTHEIGHIVDVDHAPFVLTKEKVHVPIYEKLSSRIPEWPLLFVSENGFKSMNKIERILVCRTLLRMLDSESMMSTIYKTISWPDGEKAYSKWKGNILEKFGCFFFLTEPGLTIINKKIRVRTSEIDLLIKNESNVGFWQQLCSPIAVECKNWSKKVGARDIAVFRDLLKHMQIKTGFLLSRFGVTGNDYRDSLSSIKDAKRMDGINIISLTFDDIREALNYHSIGDYISKIYYLLYQ